VLTGAVFFVVIARLLVLAKFDAVTARAILATLARPRSSSGLW
jgi:hypothetical protein